MHVSMKPGKEAEFHQCGYASKLQSALCFLLNTHLNTMRCLALWCAHALIRLRVSANASSQTTAGGYRNTHLHASSTVNV
jgi:hypothetical protein